MQYGIFRHLWQTSLASMVQALSHLPLLRNGGGGGGGGGGAVGFWPDTKSGCVCVCVCVCVQKRGEGGGRCCLSVSGGPGYPTVVESMRTGINRQRKRVIIIKIICVRA